MDAVPHSIKKELERTVRNNPEAIVALLDSAGYFVYVSDSAKEITGHTPQEAVGRHFLDFYHQPDSEHLAIAMQDVLQKGKTPMVTRDVILRSGGTRRMRGDAWKVTDDKTGKIYVLSVSRPFELASRA